MIGVFIIAFLVGVFGLNENKVENNYNHFVYEKKIFSCDRLLKIDSYYKDRKIKLLEKKVKNLMQKI